MPNQQPDSWLQHIVKQDGKAKSLTAPYIPVVHIPDDVWAVTLPQPLGMIFVPLKYLYLAAIIIGLFVGYPLIAKYGANLLYLVFLLSIAIPGFELVKDVLVKQGYISS